MAELSTIPAIDRMAGLAITGKASLDMIRVGGIIKIIRMAIITVRWQACILIACMAGRTDRTRMTAGQGEEVVVEYRTTPSIDRMTGLAIRGHEAGRCMLGIRGIIKITLVTGRAVRWDRIKNTAGMTGGTVHRRMPTA